MASENETVMAVCSEWRDCIESADPSVWNDERIAGLVKTTKAQQLAYLDRIEAAWKREREPKPLTIPEWIDHEESIADIVAEMRKMKRYAKSESNDCRYVAYWCYQTFADRIEAAWKRERESLLTKQDENVNSGSAVYTGENKGGNAAAMREALELLNQLFDSCVLGTRSEMTADEMDNVDNLYFKTKAALAAPARNCDRSECKDTTSAQLVWAKEDGGKTAYYEWLFAPAAERKGDGDGR